MNMNHLMKRFVAASALIFGVLGIFTTPTTAQVALVSTTLAAAITDPAAQQITVTSATGFVANTTAAVVDSEQMAVVSVTGTSIRVVRGISGTKATTHANAAKIWVGSPTYFDTTGRSGSCTAANERVLPVLSPTTGWAYDCIGSVWVQSYLASTVGQVFRPKFAGGIPTVYSCGNGTGNFTCANSSSGYTAHIVVGQTTLSSGSAIVSGISPAFTGTTTFSCVVQDQTTSSGNGKAVTSGVSSITITGTGSDVMWWICAGYH